MAWMDGEKIIFAYPQADDTRAIEEEFELDDLLWSEWREGFERWMYAPMFERLPEVTARIARMQSRDASLGK